MTFDGSESSRHAFELAFELALSYKATVLLLRVASLAQFNALSEDGFDLITEELHKLCQQCTNKGVYCKYRFDIGEAADQVLQAAADSQADFIIIGSSEYSKGHRLEPDWSKVLLRADGPVTVVK